MIAKCGGWSLSVEPGIESCCDPRRISEHVAVALRFDAIPANRIWPRHPSHIADQFEGRGPSRTYEVGHGNTLDRGVLRAPQRANRRSIDHRSFAEEILRRG